LLSVAEHSLLLGVSAVFLAPLAVIVLTGLMTDHQALSSSLWPRPFVWGNLTEVFREAPIARALWITIQVAGLSAIGATLTSLPVAYALACLRWRGRSAVMALTLATAALPLAVTSVPLYELFSDLGWVGTLRPLIVPNLFGDALSIFLLRQAFLAVPRELVEEARVQGASELRILCRVMVPLARPTIAAVALLAFTFNWSELFRPLLYLGHEPELWTLSLALTELRGLHTVDWNLTMTACAIFTAPVLLLFGLAQRALLDGVVVQGPTR
jgi:multiple sugar transport system permease protein